MWTGLDLHLRHHGVFADSDDDARKVVARGLPRHRQCRLTRHDLSGDPGELHTVDDHPAGVVLAQLHLPGVGPAAQRVVADTEDASCLGYPKMRHEIEITPADAGDSR